MWHDRKTKTDAFLFPCRLTGLQLHYDHFIHSIQNSPFHYSCIMSVSKLLNHVKNKYFPVRESDQRGFPQGDEIIISDGY